MSNSSKKITVIGIGPGKTEYMTIDAENCVKTADFIIGYTKYVEIVKENFPSIDASKYISTGMMKEKERCQIALQKADGGKNIALVCSGDSSVYGMASLVLELANEFPEVEINIIPGVTAALSGGAILGSPLTCDFMVLSLSNLLMPQEKIEKRLKASSLGDLVLVLYNPRSKNRPQVLKDACDILLQDRDPNTICGIVKNIGRRNSDFIFCSLKELSMISEKDNGFEIDMFCTVFIGNSETRLIEHSQRKYMINPRGYNTEKN